MYKPHRWRAGIGITRYVPDYLKKDSPPHDVVKAFIRIGHPNYVTELTECLRSGGNYDARVLYSLIEADIRKNNTALTSALTFLIASTFLAYKLFTGRPLPLYTTQTPTTILVTQTPEIGYTPLPTPSPTEEPPFIFDGPAVVYLGWDTITPYPNYSIFFGGPFDLRVINLKVPKYGRRNSEINIFLDGKVSRRGEKVYIHVEAQRKEADHIINMDVRYYKVRLLGVDGFEIPNDVIYALEESGFSGGLYRDECNGRIMWVSEYPEGEFGVELDHEDGRLYSEDYRKRLVSLPLFDNHGPHSERLVKINLESDTERGEIILNENQVVKCED